MKICLLAPPFLRRIYHTTILGFPTPSLAFLGGSAKADGHDVTLIDAKLENLTVKEVITRLRDIKPDVLGISTCTTDMPVTRKLANLTKELNPNICIILGGAHPSAMPEETLRSDNNFDVVVIGEGEITLNKVLSVLRAGGDLSNIQGIVFRKGAEIIKTPPNDSFTKLEELPMPLWEGMPKGEKYYVQVSRGCPSRCSFCFRIFGQNIRFNPPERIIAEIECIIKYADPKEFYLGSATFGLPEKDSSQLLDAIIESGLNKRIKWYTTTRVDVMDRAFLVKMKEAGCYLIGLGIEAGDDEILRKTGKFITIQQIIKCVENLKSAGIDFIGFFVFGHPYETRDTVKKSSDLAIRLNPTYLTIGIMIPWPGTEIHSLAMAGKGGYCMVPGVSIEGRNKHFGKRAMTFANIDYSYLQWLRIRTYFLLYVKNGRYIDGLHFGIKHVREGLTLVFETAREFAVYLFEKKRSFK